MHTVRTLPAAIAAAAGTAFLAPAASAQFTEVVNLDMSGPPPFDSFGFGSRPEDRGNLFQTEQFFNLDATNGDVFEVQHFHDAVDPDDPFFDDFGDGYQSFHIYDGFTYDPAVLPQIADIRFSIDIDASTNMDSVFFGLDIGTGGFANGFMPLFFDNSIGFETFTFEASAADDFSGIDFATTPVKFVFGFTSNSFDDSGSDFDVLADNFIVEIQPIPTPATLAPLAGLALLTRRRR